MAGLTEKETSTLEELEEIIDGGKGVFLEVGNALAEIKERKLFRGTHKSFSAYTTDRWKFKDSIRVTMAAKAAIKKSSKSSEPASPQQAKTKQMANLPSGVSAPSRDEAAEDFDVKPRTVQKAINVIKQGIPELQDAMTEGVISASLAERISQTPDVIQKDIVEGLSSGAMDNKSAVEIAMKAVSQLDVDDEIGLHPAVIRLLESKSEYTAKRAALTALRKWLDDEAIKGNSLLGCEIKSVHSLIEDLSSMIAACSPFAPCPYCSAIPADDPKFACNPCRGSGVVSRVVWKNAPKDSNRREMEEAMERL